MRDLIGRTLGHYRIVDKIGEGGMGVVYRAKDERLDRNVAIKVLPEEVATDSDRLRRFEREAKAVAKLDHPNILAIHDFGTDESVTYSVTELLDGQDLRQAVPASGMPWQKVVEMGAAIADGLAAAHGKGIVHRDLKPENVFVTSDGRVKVLDFGLAQMKEPVDEEAATATLTPAGTAVGTVMGTMGYMSPEQLRGERADARSDIFALGCVLYEMLSGRTAFLRDSTAETTAAILKEEPERLSSTGAILPADVERCIHRCLEKNQEARFQSASDLAYNLRSISIDQVISPVTAPKGKFSGQRRRMIWLAAVAAIVVVVLVGFNVGGLRDRLWRGFGAAGPADAILLEKAFVAVLPFENLSPDPGNQYFSDGMTEELISKLSRIHTLQVLSRTSVARFRGTEKDIKEIGDELGVRYLVEGSVRKAGDRVRITAQLIDTSTGFHLWSDDFDGELEDVFGVQEDTALRIAEALDLQLSPQEMDAVHRHDTENPQAYDAYLRGWALAENFLGRFASPERLEAARRHFERALAFDPDYPLALAGLSEIEGWYYFFGVDRTPDRIRRSEELARRALALDPQLSEAHTALGDVYGAKKDYVLAVDEFRQAVRLDPGSAYAWEELAWALTRLEPPDPEEAEKAAREAIRLQPAYFWSYYQLGQALRLQARYKESIAALEDALQLSPEFRHAYSLLGRVYRDQGNHSQALAQFNKARSMGETPGLLVEISAAYAALGEREKSLAELEQALADGYQDFAAIEANPHFDSLRADPRFQALLEEYDTD
jgi:serine/threonine protein kinase/Tfp pilus assembly protein PilF